MQGQQKQVLGMVLKGFPRISETFISNEILLLERMGVKIHIISMRQPREIFTHASVKQIQATVDYLPETLLRPLPRLIYHNARRALKSPRRYARALKMALRRFRRSRKFATLKHLLQAGLLVQTILPDSGVVHLHAHFAHSPTSVTLFASILSGLPFSFTAHAKDIYTSDPAQLAEKINRAKFVVTCTAYNQRYLRHLAPETSTAIHCVYHGINTRLFRAEENQRRCNTPYHLLTVARMTRKKGLPTVYRALKHLRDRGVAFQHTLIGDGDDRARILDLIADLGLSNNCQWLGTLPHEKVLAHYRQSDLFVLGCEIAADGDRDGIPNVLMESMAMGVPVVCTRISAIPELVEHESTGLLVAPRAPEAMAEAIIRLLSERPLREQLIANAKHKVNTEFDNHRLIGKLFGVMQTAIQNDVP